MAGISSLYGGSYSSYSSYGNYGTGNSGALNSLYNSYSIFSKGLSSVSNIPNRQYSGNTASTGAETRNFLTNVKDISGKLKDAANKLLYGHPPVFQQMAAAISDKEAATAKSVSSAVTLNTKPVELNIKQVATGQKNTGDALSATGKDFAAGSSAFSISAGGKTYNLFANISAADNNRSAQQKMADAINKSGSGLSATVAYDEATKKNSLVIESKTGEKNGFTIQDEGGGSLVAKSGAANVATQAKDAVYTVNGGYDRVSSSNDVNLGNGMSVTLNKAADKVTVSAKRDVTAGVNGVYDFVNNYNALMDAAKNFKSGNSDKLVSRLSGAANTYASSMAKSGVTTDANGYLKIDTEKLKTSVENGTAAGTFGGAGVTTRVESVARNANSNPGQYTGGVAYGGSYNSSYNSTYSNGFINNFYSQYAGYGLLFDAFA